MSQAFLWNFGVGYDFLGDDEDEGLSSINAFSIQAGMSVFLGGR